MKIVFPDAYFFPETIAYTHLEKGIMSALIDEGDKISVICPTPTRNVSDDTAKEYEKIKHQVLENGIEITRFSAPREGKNPVIRALRYLLCGARHYALTKKSVDADAVFAVSTPPTQGLVAAKAAKALSKKQKKKIPFIYNLQDVFPDSLVTTGLTKEGSLIWKIGRKIENKTYKSADKIIVASNSMRENILKKGVPAEKIEVVPNWIDTDAVAPVKKEDNRLYDEFSLPKDKFLVVYAGNFGAAQGAEIVLDVAEKLSGRKDILFVLFGGGAGFSAAQQRASAMENVVIHGLLPAERISEVYSLGDIALITCKKGVGTSGMPSKTWSIMACNTPIIASFDTKSELSDILAASGGGICVEPEDKNSLSDAIESFLENPSNACSRDYVTLNASASICTKKYAKIIHGAICAEEIAK